MNEKLQNKEYLEKVFQEILNDHKDNTRECKYLQSLNEKEKRALVISKVMLESSFSVEKSIGFLKSGF